ncbi:DedA family protein [Geobacillus subterraneus]|uniref:DedA family protein n=1 Tax=Geobacillus subterraneus TaxID=129338 RepID=UPI001442AA50|nr:DedA family protein [Geobacillus subterraneus]QIZ66731.1 DedA family protein [Geobacillus subterraneus]
MQHYLHYLIDHFGYIGIMIALMLGIVGLPIPDELLLTYAGYRVSTGAFSYPLTFFSCSFGAAIGISLSYILGFTLGLPFLHKFGPKLHLTEKRLEQTKALFSKFGPAVLFICYFIPGVRHLTAFWAGMNAYQWRKFALFAYSGAMVWVAVFLTIGAYFESRWTAVKQYIDAYRPLLFPVFLIVFGFALFYWHTRQKRKTPD